jgi:indolepyruvate ferredoxin oxidoreductase beta subunit
MPVDVNVGKRKSLNINETQKELGDLFSNVIAFDATSIAERLREPRAVNSVMLGALSALDKIPITIEKFKEAIEARMPKRVIKINLEAFDEGYQKITKKG